ncbi:hypothetical protein KI387_025815 [Taxus chinensis]|uniref:DUF4283 domain-containing protein n=1 Tax=Taxus chinensis TaxID=29808 RepID=A0AA38FVC5_TAXCH|nr:hypothetical protein KI387_025815 [Taxus chinensis]
MTRIENFGDFSHPQLDVESGGSNEKKGLGLIRMLLATADLMGSQQYDAAFQMILQCKQLSTPYGDSMERIGYYFTDAMEEKIELDTRGFINTMTSAENLLNIKEKIKEVEMASISWYQSLPYSKVAHFTANQAILEAVGTASNIHIIDFDIKDGLQWPNLMQSLTLRQSGPPEILKITAITRQRFHKTKKAGKRLSSFAKSLNISFTFKMVIINKINDVNSDMFGVDPMEAVVVNASVMLQGLFQEPNSLRLIVDAIASLRPLVFTVIHNEGEHNSISFIKRFIEVLFYYSAIFDSLDAVNERWDLNRVRVERFFVAPGIRNMVAHEGKERVIRHVEAEVWGSFMKQAGFRGLAFSNQARYQAGLVVKDFGGGFVSTVTESGEIVNNGSREAPSQVCAESIPRGNDSPPDIVLPLSEFDSTCKWLEQFCLIGYFVGRTPSESMLKSWVQSAWTAHGIKLDSIQNLTRGFFCLRFADPSHASLILNKQQTWYVRSSLLVLSPWTRDFVVFDQTALKVPVWVEFPGLPMLCCDFLERIVVTLGCVIYTEPSRFFAARP